MIKYTHIFVYTYIGNGSNVENWHANSYHNIIKHRPLYTIYSLYYIVRSGIQVFSLPTI